MNDQRHAHGFKRHACQFRTVRRRRSGHFASLYMRKKFTPACSNTAPFFNTRVSPMPSFPVHASCTNSASPSSLLQRGADLVLQGFEEG